MSIFLGSCVIDRFLYLISKRTQAALLLVATDEHVSFSFRTVTASAARASQASMRRQLESVPRISSWISSNSFFSLDTSRGIKPACSMPTAPTGGDTGGTQVGCQCIYYFYLHFHLLNRLKLHMVTHFLPM